MKQNGVRLVQRKFAQGVPLPASSGSNAPPPPERKADPPYPPKSVYHNSMSARCLLDIVSMQNIHKHKQEPLVVLERLRDDEIPSPLPKVRRIRKRRVKPNKNNMCLRSGKRKSTDAAKAVARKRKKLSSESTDDVPLMYYFNRPNQAKHKPKDTDKKDRSSDREKRTLPPKRRERTGTLVSEKSVSTRAESIITEKSDDRSFTFKEPTNPARLSYRMYKKKAAAKAVRSLKKAGVPLNGRWSSLRSARGAEPRLARPLRPQVLLGKKPSKPTVRKGSRSVKKEEKRPSLSAPFVSDGDSGNGSTTSVRDSVDFSTILAQIDTTRIPSPACSLLDVVNLEPKPTPPLTYDSDSESASGRQDWCINETNVKSELQDKDGMTILQRVNRSSSITELNTKEGLIILELKSEATTLAETSENKEMSNSKETTQDTQKEENPKEKCKKRKDGSKVTNSDAEKRQTNNLEAQKTRTNNLDIQKRQTNNLDAEKRSTDNLDVEKRQESLVADSNTTNKNNVNVESDVENREERQCVQESQKRGEKKALKAKTTTKKTVEKNETKKNSKKPATKAAPKETKKSMPKRGAKTVPEEPPASTRLLRNSRETQPPPPPNPDVYEFDAELEASRPPSSLRRRGQPADVAPPAPEPAPPAQDPAQPASKPPSPDNVEYLDILPSSLHCVEITPKKQPETGAEFPSLRLVPKEEISTKQKNLIENLSNSPALLSKFFNCLTAEMQTELGNLIAAEGLSEASTSKEETYLVQKAGSVYEAPTFYPTAEEFEDPIKYYDKIAPEASKYGLCKIVPPEGFEPPCNMSDTIRFAVIYQYISKMYSRWGPVSRELAAIKAHLRTQSVVFARSPLLDGSEVNLPKLYHAVERNGGLSKVIQRKRWGRVADEMKLTKLQHPERKLDPIYMRYLLPYATLSDQERQNIMAEVEKCWTTKYQKMLERARNPFQRQNRMLGTECESESDDESEDGNTCGALHEAEDCIVQGRTMNLVTFKKIATSLMDAHFEPGKQPPTDLDVEKAYWRAVLLGTEHIVIGLKHKKERGWTLKDGDIIVANTASIDTGEEGYGFPKDPEAQYGTHPWNLKVLARNPNNVLRYLGPVLGVTVPTLHLSMLFSTSCWHRDPHGLPWTEYMHNGADKIWYGIPQDESANFRRAVETLCPAYCQNKSIWLASEITMVPPNILSEHGVKLSKLLQRPGEYVLVFPEAHSCSITTGFGISESVYFASNAWLTDVYKLFQELRNSCEPTMFSLEQLLLNGSADPSAPSQVCSVLCTLLSAELEHRRALEHRGLKVQERPASSAPLNTSYFRAWNTRDQDECEYCRSTLFLSKVTGLTGRKSAVCPEHALRLLETKKYKNIELSSLEFVSSYSTSALEDMLERLESRTAAEDSRAPSVIDLTGPEREVENNTSCSLGREAKQH